MKKVKKKTNLKSRKIKDIIYERISIKRRVIYERLLQVLILWMKWKDMTVKSEGMDEMRSTNGGLEREWTVEIG